MHPPKILQDWSCQICHRQCNSPRGVPLQFNDLIGTAGIEWRKSNSWESITFFKYTFWNNLHDNATLVTYSQISSRIYLWTIMLL
jgi:hypothetical protein